MGMKNKDNVYRRIVNVDLQGHIFYDDWQDKATADSPGRFDMAIRQSARLDEQLQEELKFTSNKVMRDAFMTAAYRALKSDTDICLEEDEWEDVLEAKQTA